MTHVLGGVLWFLSALVPMWSVRFEEIFIARPINLYVLAGAIVAGLLFIFIMAYAIYEMFKH